MLKMYTFPRIISPLLFDAIIPNTALISCTIQTGANTIQLRNKNSQDNQPKQEIAQYLVVTRHYNS